MTFLLVILYVIVCIFLILVVLLQQGKGADLAGAFGGAGTQTAFGPRGSTTIMHRLTTASFVLFVLLSMALAIVQGNRGASVMEDVEPAPTTPVAAPALPGEEPATEPIAEPGVGTAEPADAAAPAAEVVASPAADGAAAAPATAPTPPVESE